MYKKRKTQAQLDKSRIIKNLKRFLSMKERIIENE